MSENTIDGGLFFRRVLLVALVATLVVIVLLNLQSVVHYLLVVFAGVLLAVFLDGMATFLSQRTRLPRALALGLVVVVLFGLLAGSVWVAGPSVADQLAGLTERVPGAVNTVRAALEGTEWGRELLGKIPDFETLLSHWADVARFVQLALASTVSAIVDAIIILFIGTIWPRRRTSTGTVSPGCFPCGDGGESTRSWRAPVMRSGGGSWGGSPRCWWSGS